MKTKKFIQIYGKVMLPVIRGMSAMYFSNGTWKETAKVRRIVEVTDTYIKFETDRIRYCIDFGMVEVLYCQQRHRRERGKAVIY